MLIMQPHETDMCSVKKTISLKIISYFMQTMFNCSTFLTSKNKSFKPKQLFYPLNSNKMYANMDAI